MIHIFLMAALVLIGLNQPVYAQNSDISARNFSIKLNGGLTYASGGGGVLGPLLGQFDVESYQKSIYGAAIEYAFNPEWSFEAAFNTGSFNNQFADDPAFSTDYIYTTFRGVTHLNNLLDLNWRGNTFVNPYLAIGLGMIRTRMSADGLDSEDLSLMLSSGAGAVFYLLNSADLFVQYDYNMAGSNLLDGFSGSRGSDKFAVVKAGVRINFGSKNTKLASWPSVRPAVRRSAPLKQPVLALAHEPQAEPERPDMTWVSDLGTYMESPMARHPEFVERAVERAQQMKEARIIAEARAAERARLEAEKRAAAALAATVIQKVSTPPDGAYIQIGSFPNDKVAEEKWREVVADLSGVVLNPEERVLIQEYQQYRRVIIGPFGTVRQTRAVLNAIQSSYGDAFLITFPRN